MLEMFDLTGHKAIVTGGTRGLGRGVAEGLMEAGAEVVIFGSNEKALEVAAGYRQAGFRCHGIAVDLADAAAREAAFYQALEVLGGELQILVNAAGIQSRHKCEEFPFEDWERVLNINLNAPFALCQLAGREFLKKGYGKIINFSSMTYHFGGYTIPAYAASKGGITQLTKALCNEWAGHGITVNCVAPGYMDTEMNTALTDPANPRYKEITDRIPAHRWGTGDDMKGACIFLASHASDYVNGAVLTVDGGYLVK
jgi:2-deoxy-D-gluconate 3-dehydrogenase